MAINDSSTGQKIESIHQCKKKKQHNNEHSDKLELPNSESEELVGNNDENNFVEKSERIGSGKKSRKRKRGKNGNEETNDRVEIIELGNGVTGSGGGYVGIEERKDGGDRVGVGNNVGDLGKSPEESGFSKKKKRRRKKKSDGVGNRDGCEGGNKEKGEMGVEEVNKDVEMFEVQKEETKGQEDGNGEKPKPKKKRKKPKKGEKEVVVIKCFVCDATDHNAKYCPQKSDWFKNKICLICRKQGHSLGSCPNSNGQSRMESAYKNGGTKTNLTESAQPFADVNDEDRPQVTKVDSRTYANKDKAAEKKAKRVRNKENKKQRKRGTEAV